MSTMSYFHFLACVTYLFLAGSTLRRAPRALVNRLCAATLTCFGIWSLGVTMVHNPHHSRKLAMLFDNVGALGWIGFGCFFLWFAAAFTERKRLVRAWWFYAIPAFISAMIVYDQWTTGLLHDYRREWYGWLGSWRRSPWTYLFFGYYFTAGAAGLYLIADYGRRTRSARTRQQAWSLFYTGLPPLVLGTLSNVGCRLLGIRHIPPVGDLLVLGWAGGMVYAMSKYRFLGITPALAADNIIADMSDFLVLADREGKIVSVNKLVRRTLGYREGELEGRSVEQLFPEGDRQMLNVEGILAGEDLRATELSLRTKGGELSPVSLTASALRSDNGAVEGVVFLGRDISMESAARHSLERAKENLEAEILARTQELREEIEERQRAEEELQATTDRLKVLFEYAPDAIYLNDLKGAFVDGNRKAEEIAGYNKEELIGKNLFDLKLLPRSDLPRAAKLLGTNVMGKPTGPDEFVLNRKDGTTVEVEIRTFPVRIGGKKLVLGVARDVTERRSAQQEKERLEDRLRQSQKLEAIGQLAGGVAHDFNNVLGAISGYAQMMRNVTRDNPKLAKYAETILSAAERAADLTAKLLAFARKGKFEITTVDLHEAIDDTIKILEHALDKRIEVVQQLNAAPPTVLGDRSQIQNIVLNLAVNARDAMPEGGTLTLTTELTHLDDPGPHAAPEAIAPGVYVKLTVTDTGGGIPEAIRERIFEPFFTTKEPGRGTGLGLASVYGIVKSHSGHIDVHSTPRKGTTFEVYLPSTKKPVTRDNAGNSEAKTGRGSGRILVVDDEDFMRNLSADLLENLGYTVQTCADGEEAIGVYRKNHERIDVVLLDLIMPRLGGLECFARLKEIDPEVKVIVSSGYAVDEEAERVLAAGVAGFVKKPFGLSELARSVAEALRPEDAEQP